MLCPVSGRRGSARDPEMYTTDVIATDSGTGDLSGDTDRLSLQYVMYLVFKNKGQEHMDDNNYVSLITYVDSMCSNQCFNIDSKKGTV